MGRGGGVLSLRQLLGVQYLHMREKNAKTITLSKHIIKNIQYQNKMMY